jgi:penicillin-binding protein 2
MPSRPRLLHPWRPPFRDDKEGGHGNVDMRRSIVVSCNTYYYMLANDMGINAIHDFMKPFGFGQITGIDLDNEKRGVLPSTEWKRTASANPSRKWVGGDTISGHRPGYNSFTPLQSPTRLAILANNGVVMKPHLVKIIEDGVPARAPRPCPGKLPHPAQAGKHRLHQARHGGRGQEGTGAAAFRGAPYESGGKTGTAQVVNIAKNQKYDSKKLSHLPRQRPVHRLCAGRQAAHRHCGRGRRTVAGARRGCPDGAQGHGLLHAGQAPQ